MTPSSAIAEGILERFGAPEKVENAASAGGVHFDKPRAQRSGAPDACGADILVCLVPQARTNFPGLRPGAGRNAYPTTAPGLRCAAHPACRGRQLAKRREGPKVSDRWQ